MAADDADAASLPSWMDPSADDLIADLKTGGGDGHKGGDGFDAKEEWRVVQRAVVTETDTRHSARQLNKADLVPQVKSVAAAREHANTQRVGMRLRADAPGEPTVRRFPICGCVDPHAALQYGVPIAMDVYLRMLLMLVCMFVLMFGLEVPGMLDNARRNHLRNDCRSTLASDYDALVKDSCDASDASELCFDCGFQDLPLRKTQLPDVSFYLQLTLGACMEYTDGTTAPPRSLPTCPPPAPRAARRAPAKQTPALAHAPPSRLHRLDGAAPQALLFRHALRHVRRSQH